MREVDRAYIAGLVDGEGCITLQHQAKRRFMILRVSITNVNREVLEFVRAIYGGSVSSRNPRSRKSHWRDIYQYLVVQVDAKRLLDDIRVYSIVKRGQIEVVSRYWKTVVLPRELKLRKVPVVRKDNGSLQMVSYLRPEIVAEREACKQEIHRLNWRGREAWPGVKTENTSN